MSGLQIQIARLPGGWWWLALVSPDGRALDVLDRLPHRSAAEARKAELEAKAGLCTVGDYQHAQRIIEYRGGGGVR